jgi:peptidoglycan/LPS O-acetylase OafA/YrhL
MSVASLDLLPPIVAKESTSTTRRASRRIEELDGIRGFAALGVVAYHLWSYYVPFGWLGVDLFFVLSGFLITSIIIEGIQQSGFLSRFYLRRASRIVPIYYLCIGAITVLNAALSLHLTLLESLPWYLTYTQNTWMYFGVDGPFLSVLGHTWTLAIEEQFYLVWPLAIWLAGSARIIPMSCLLVLVSGIARAFGFHEHLLLTKCDGFAFGAIGAALLAATPTAPSIRWLFRAMLLLGSSAVGVAVAWFGVRRFAADEGAIISAQSVVWMPIIYAMFLGSVGVCAVDRGHLLLAPLRWRPIRYVGTISYGLYLYHYIVIVLLRQFPEVSQAVGRVGMSILIVGASMSIASFSWHWLEEPILRWMNAPPRDGAAAA